MSNTIGNTFKVTVFGQSHAPSLGCVIEGLPAGYAPDEAKIRAFMQRRAPGSSALATARREPDIPEILSGLNEFGRTCGAPLAMRIVNTDQRSKDYSKLRDLPRPGHADYSASVRYDGENDIRGGGQFSGRLTAPLCFAGAIALDILEARGVRIRAHVSEIAGICDAEWDHAAPNLDAVCDGDLPVLDHAAGEAMRRAILEARREGDSVGGVIEAAAIGFPSGLGDPMFDGVENLLARAFFGIPAVRGVEFGAGFSAACMRGSTHNDAFCFRNGAVRTETNRHGGILGGITTGMPIIARVAIKPTPSILRRQHTVSLSAGENAELVIEGRHDPCIVPRAVPVVEAMMAITLLDILLTNRP